MSRRIVIIGGGPAGSMAALAAKHQDAGAEVILLEAEPFEPYEKPPLSKAVLLGHAQPTDAHIFAGSGGVAALDIKFKANVHCESVDAAEKFVMLSDGEHIAYDALVLATGSRPRMLAGFPKHQRGIHYLRSAADACALRDALTYRRRLLAIGGGVIGLEVAASAATLGTKATVIETAPRILPRLFDAMLASVVHEKHSEHGVDIMVDTTIRAVETCADEFAVSTTRGTLTADLIVVGVGAIANDMLAQQAGLAVSNGILVDAECRTSNPSIFAAGDVACLSGPTGYVRLENWRHALDQGTTAGRNAAGATERYVPLPSVWSEQYDLYLQSLGWQTEGAAVIHRALGSNRCISFQVLDNQIRHAEGINAQREMSIARRLMERNVSISTAALADVHHPLSRLLQT